MQLEATTFDLQLSKTFFACYSLKSSNFFQAQKFCQLTRVRDEPIFMQANVHLVYTRIRLEPRDPIAWLSDRSVRKSKSDQQPSSRGASLLMGAGKFRSATVQSA